MKNVLKDAGAVREAISDMQQAYVDMGMTSGKKVLPFLLTANLITQEQYDELKSNCEHMSRILDKVADAYFKEGKFRDLFELKEQELFDMEPGYSSFCVISRYDLFYDGGIKLLEFNSESPSGMGRMALLDKMFMDTFKKLSPEFEAKAPPDMRQELLDAFLKIYNEWGGEKEKLTIALIDWDWIKTASDQRYIAEYFVSQGHDAFMCDPTKLGYDGKLKYEGKEIDLVYRRAITVELMEKREECKALFEALKDKAICMVNSFRSNLSSDKRLLHLLSSRALDEVLDESDIRLIREIIPWTREMSAARTTDFDGNEVDLKQFMLDNKDSLVLKPADDYGGKDIHIGIQEDNWEEIVEKAVSDQNWIVQRYVEIPQIDVPEVNGEVTFKKEFINLCPFVVGGKMTGFLTRVSESKIINTSRGATVIPTFIKNG